MAVVAYAYNTIIICSMIQQDMLGDWVTAGLIFIVYQQNSTSLLYVIHLKFQWTFPVFIKCMKSQPYNNCNWQDWVIGGVSVYAPVPVLKFTL